MTPIEALTHAIAQHGSRNKFCKANGLSLSYVADVLNGRREPGPKILAVIGWERITEVKPKEQAK